MHAAIIGARGYAGREILRLLNAHPHITQVTPISDSVAGDAVSQHIPSMAGSQLRFADSNAARGADVVFLATPHNVAKQWVTPDDGLVIDLSRDHRDVALAKQDWHYGAADIVATPEGHERIANPGCYPTAAAIAMAPLVAAGVVGDGTIIVDGKSGISGAGITPRPDLHFPEAESNVKAYKIDGHDHQEEIQGVIANAGGSNKVRFTPHLVPQSRGLLTTCYLPLGDATPAEVQQALVDAYADSPFVHVVDEPATGHVRMTNQAHVAAYTDVDAGLIIARCAIDNLLKGAAGTAVQNMNMAFDWATTAGLEVR